MKRTIIITSLLVCAGLVVSAQNTDDGLARNVSLARNGNYMAVTMDLDLAGLEVPCDRALLITPAISNGDSLVTLQSVGVYSHTRWFYYKRNGEVMISGEDEISLRKSDKPNSLSYETVVPYREWMNGAELSLTVGEYGCCSRLMSKASRSLTRYEETAPYVPQLIYMVPKAETVKSRSLSGRAYIGFPVNETVIYPEFQNNLEELAKIRATIDSVRNDSDVTIYAMSIKGFASPESPYDNNARLASGRTQAVKQYVNELYDFAPEFISTSYEPEDWEGLRRFVESSSIPHKKEILAIIDSGREPDNKEWKIKSEYKDDYRYLLDNCYPYLRHSDYVVEYVVRSYADPDEIGRIMMERPQNLSLNEFYVYAQTLEQGSPEFIEVFETAVRMYPRDEAANLNAANTAMSRGDFISALRYLDKAGNSPETIYASGVCAYLAGYMDQALELMKKARDLGVGQAAEVIEVIENKK